MEQLAERLPAGAELTFARIRLHVCYLDDNDPNSTSPRSIPSPIFFAM